MKDVGVINEENSRLLRSTGKTGQKRNDSGPYSICCVHNNDLQDAFLHALTLRFAT
jgi:hypothetical protein